MPNRAGKPWTETEEKELMTAFHAERDMNEVAYELGRSVSAVITRLNSLCLAVNQNGKVYMLVGVMRDGTLDYL
jgi:hypothetical protein